MSLHKLTISGVAEKLAQCEVSAREIMQSCSTNTGAWMPKSTLLSAMMPKTRSRKPMRQIKKLGWCHPCAKAAAWYPNCYQRRTGREKPAAQLRVEDSRKVHFAL